MAGGEDRRYRIKTHESYGFWTGITPDRSQVLMGLGCPDLIAFFFDTEGNLLHVERRSIEFFRCVIPPYDIYDERIPALIDAWKMGMGLQPATIEVKKFFSEEHQIGIDDYPEHFDEILSAPHETEEEKSNVRDSMRLWDADGQFVLLWGNDYWLDKSGEVVSS